jgi:aminoglycoside phosphotransferase (APT) family kinase protein
MRWLAGCSVAALREALEAVAPELSGYQVTVPGPAGQEDPLWHSGCVPVGDHFFVKFAWSRPAALRLAWEIGALAALACEPKVPFLPEVAASSANPLLMITRRTPGTSLFEVADSIDPDRAARQLVWFLAALHHPGARQRAEAAVGTLAGPQLPPATTRTLRQRLGTWIRPDQYRAVVRWCDWADAVLGSPGPAVLVHGDLHGDNQIWDHDELRLMLDSENIGAAEPEYELRGFPGPGMGPGPGAGDRDHAPLPAGHRTAAVDRTGDGLAPEPRPWRCAVAQRSRPPAGRSPDTTTVGRGPGRTLQRPRHRSRTPPAGNQHQWHRRITPRRLQRSLINRTSVRPGSAHHLVIDALYQL